MQMDCHSECDGRVGIGYRCVVECYCGFKVVVLAQGVIRICGF